MIIPTVALLIGLLVLAGGLYYLSKEKQDAESKKIYGITAAAGAVVTVIAVVMWMV